MFENLCSSVASSVHHSFHTLPSLFSHSSIIFHHSFTLIHHLPSLFSHSSIIFHHSFHTHPSSSITLFTLIHHLPSLFSHSSIIFHHSFHTHPSSSPLYGLCSLKCIQTDGIHTSLAGSSDVSLWSHFLMSLQIIRTFHALQSNR